MILTYHVVLTAAHSLFSYITDPELRFTARLTSSLKRACAGLCQATIFLAPSDSACPDRRYCCDSILPAIYALWRQFYLSHAYEQESVRAATDSLTGVANREGFRRYLSRTLSPDKLPAAVLFVDIDDFKSLNDRFGHEFETGLLYRSIYFEKVSPGRRLDCQVGRGRVYRISVEHLSRAGAFYCGKDLRVSQGV